MKFLLPHSYKKVGAIILPLGLLLWILMQFGVLKKLLIYLFGATDLQYAGSTYHVINIIAAIMGFFSFLGGLYLISFSKEKIEDEMVQRTRLESFQFAAIVQILLAIAGFIFIAIGNEPQDGGLMLFFISLLLLFWLTFIGRFNYILHIKLKQ